METYSSQLNVNPPSPPVAPAKKGKAESGVSFYLLFYLLLDAAQTKQDTVMEEAKDISCNSNAQKEINGRLSSIHMSVIPNGAHTATITQVQQRNQEYAAERANLQDELITSRQNAQVMMTTTSTNVNELEQDASEDAGWLKALNTIFQVIVEMGQAR